MTEKVSISCTFPGTLSCSLLEEALPVYSHIFRDPFVFKASLLRRAVLQITVISWWITQPFSMGGKRKKDLSSSHDNRSFDLADDSAHLSVESKAAELSFGPDLCYRADPLTSAEEPALITGMNIGIDAVSLILLPRSYLISCFSMPCYSTHIVRSTTIIDHVLSFN